MNAQNTLYFDCTPRPKKERANPFAGLALAVAILASVAFANATVDRSPSADIPCTVELAREARCSLEPSFDTRVNSPATPFGQCALVPFRTSSQQDGTP